MVGEKSSKAHNFQLIIRNEKLIVIALIVFATVLRIIRIATREIAYDDAFSFFLSIKKLNVIVQGTIADTMPPLYYFALHFFTLIRNEIWFLRTLNILISIAIFLILYFLSRELFGKETGYLALFFAAISPFLIYHSQELRMYNLMLLGQLGYLYSLIMISNHPEKFKKYFFVAIIFGTIALYSHNLAIVGLLASNSIYFFNKCSQLVRSQALIFITMLILFLPWAVFVPQQIAKVQTAFWTPKPGILEIIQAIITSFAFAPMPLYWMVIVTIIIIEVVAIVLLWINRQKQTSLYFLVCIGLMLPTLLFIISYLTRPVFVPRIFILSTVLAYILISRFVIANRHAVIGKVVLASMLLVSLISLPYYYTYQSFPRSSFLQAVNYLEINANQDTLILHDSKLSFFPMMYYAPELMQTYLADPEGSANDTLALQSQEALGYVAMNEISGPDLPDNLFFVTFVQSEHEYNQLGLSNPHIVKLKTIYKQEGSFKTIDDIKIYHFERVP